MTLEVKRPAPGDLALRTDVEAVGQILFNLVDNACKYARDGQRPSIDLRVEAADGALRISVRDYGGGIRPAEARSIFLPFDRGSNSATGKPGIGLGLALARGLARDLGGDLELKPSDAGACFELALPLGR